MITTKRKQEIQEMAEADAIEDYNMGQISLLDMDELDPEDVGLNTLEELKVYIEMYNAYVNE